MEQGQDELGRRDVSTLQVEKDTSAGTELITLSVVVPTFNSADCIFACLASVHSHLPHAEVIVVDNGSSDETCEVVREGFPGVSVLSGHGNVGFGQACNLGADRASGEYVLYLNPDAELVSVDHQALATLARRRPFGMLSAMLIEAGGLPRPSVRHRYDRWITELVASQILAILSPLAPRPRYVTRAAGRGTYSVSGAVLLVAADEFRSFGGFDESFFMYYEDTDLSQRYLRAGHPLRSTPVLVARHLGGASAPTPRRLALSFLGWVEYVDKWHGRTAATRAAQTAHVAYSLLLSVLHPLAKVTGNRRVRAKTEQLSAMLSYVAAGGADVNSSDLQGRYPTAVSITAHRFRSFAR